MIFSFFKKKKIGICLGGGAARGYAHIAVLQRLSKEGVMPAAVSGCSAGALIGAYYCLHGEVDSLLEKVQKMKNRDFIALIDLNNPLKSMIRGKKIRTFFIDEFFGNATFDDLKIPLTIVATDLQSLKMVEFRKGKLVDAVMASIAIPGIFPPIEIDGYVCTDGGVSNHLPYQLLFTKHKVHKVITVDLMGGVRRRDGELHAKDYNIFDVLFVASYGLLRNTQIEAKYSGKVMTLIPKFSQKKTGGPVAFHKVMQNFTPGKECIDAKISDLMKWL